MTPIAQHRDIGYTLTDLKNHSEAARNNLRVEVFEGAMEELGDVTIVAEVNDRGCNP